jgi:hypothetical protein
MPFSVGRLLFKFLGVCCMQQWGWKEVVVAIVCCGGLQLLRIKNLKAMMDDECVETGLS